MKPARIVAALFLALSLGGCTGFLFYPESQLLITPDRAGIAYRDVEFAAADGTALHGWFLPAHEPAIPDKSCTVVYMHGNAENISTHVAAVWWLPAQGYNVFLFDYRGYGHSAGEAELPGLHMDVEAALDEAFTMEGVDPERIVVFAQSLGGAVTVTALARSQYRHRVRALILDSALSSYRGITREKLAGFWLTWLFQWPLSLTVNNDYKPLEEIAAISPTPVLVIHGLADQVVPPHHGDALYAAAAEPKEKWLLPGVGHTRAVLEKENRQRIVDYLAAHCGGG